MTQARDLLGQRFGRLLVVGQAPTMKYTRWHCLCDCGNTKIVSLQLLSMGDRGARSCGCLRREVCRENGRRVAPIGSAVRWPKAGDGGRTLAKVWR